MSKPKPDPVAEEQLTKPQAHVAKLKELANAATDRMEQALAGDSAEDVQAAAVALATVTRRLIRAKAAAKKRTLRVLTARRQRAMDAAAQAEKDLAAAGA